jgi:hypothetical protein
MTRIALSILAALSLSTFTFADERGRHEGGHDGHDGHENHEGGGRVVVTPPPGPPPAQVHRSEPPKWQPHPPGPHPHGPVVRQHPVRVLAPRPYGAHAWHHWSHPEYARPVYYWNWTTIHNVTCVAEDSYGDQYPVAATWTPGWGLQNMTYVEDEALDRCYQESGGDQSCYLATCSHY